ncbi:MAG TPA: hypothetical protein VGH51_11770 [Candidatus Angelobacter sp.]|jgi:membrane-associated HD superfamily phosphohydrolase
MKSSALLSLILALLSLPVVAQQHADKEELKRAFTEKLLQIRADELKQCQQKLQEWQGWATVNAPKNDALIKNNEELAQENLHLQSEKPSFAQMVGVGVGVGMGLGIIACAALFWRKLAPSSPRKQLTILTLCSLWIIVAGVALSSERNLSMHPINLLVSVFIYSMPAILFGAISLWWLKRTKPDVIKLW